MRRTNIKIGLIALLWSFSTAQALPAVSEPLNYQDTLHFTWAGLGLGNLTIHMQQQEAQYTMQADAKSGGIVSLFNKHRSTTKIEGEIQKESYIPKHYRSDYVDNNDTRLIEIFYDKAGHPEQENIIPPREEIRPLVAQEAKNTAVDILTGFFQMRQRLIWALQNKKKDYSVTIYDGKRLFRVDATIASTKQNVLIHATNTTLPSIKLMLQRVALAGYKDKELKSLAKRNPPIALYVEPERLVPFGLSLKVYGAKLEAWIKPEKPKK